MKVFDKMTAFVVFLLNLVYFCALSYLPFLINNSIAGFLVDKSCLPGSECLELMSKFLFVDLANITIFSAFLIWPYALWSVGQSLYRFIKTIGEKKRYSGL